jgi:hypothetical protein
MPHTFQTHQGSYCPQIHVCESSVLKNIDMVKVSELPTQSIPKFVAVVAKKIRQPFLGTQVWQEKELCRRLSASRA